MRLVLVPLALAELRDAANFYAISADLDLGLAFVAEFERTANFILANPEIGAAYRSAQRRYRLRRFPYSIVYQIAGQDLRVIAVAHQGRRPGYWAGRK